MLAHAACNHRVIDVRIFSLRTREGYGQPVALLLFESHLEPGHIRRRLRAFIHHPNFMSAGGQDQCVDVVRKFAAVIRHHR